MPRLSKAEAARQMGISRTTLYKLIQQGKLSVHPDGSIDTAELVRAVSALTPPHGQREHSTPVHRERMDVHDVHHDVHDLDIDVTGGAHRERSQRVHREHHEQAPTERQLTAAYQTLMDTLQEQLRVTRERLQAVREEALEREQAHREELAWLRHQFDQMQHRYDRLLEAPRAAPLAQASRATSARGDPHAMRKRILEVLQAHPQGMHHAQVAQALGVESNLGPTLRSMLRDRLVRRVGLGVYAAAENAPAAE